MKKLIGIVLLLLAVFINTGKCNSIPIDTLRISVRNLPDDSVKVIKLSDLSRKYLSYNIDTSAQLARDAIQLSKEVNNFYGFAYALKQMGLVFKTKSQYDSSLVYYQKSYECFDSLNINLEKGRMINRIANVNKRKGDFDKALEGFYSALDIAIMAKDSVLISAIYNNLGLLYFNMKQLDKALEYYKLNLDFIESSNLKDDISLKLINIGNLYKEKGQYEVALDYYKRALDLTSKTAKSYDKLLLLHNIGVVYEQTNKLNEANNFYQSALQLENDLGVRSLKVFTLQGIGNVFFKKGNFKKSEKYLKESMELAEEIGDLPKQLRLSQNLRYVYEKEGLYKRSLYYSKLSSELKDSLIGQEKVQQIALLEQKYEAKKREQQIAFLEKEQALQKLELTNKEIENKQKSLQRNGLVIAIIFAVIIVIYLYRVNKKRKRLLILLQKQNRKILDQRAEIAKQNDELIESNETKDKLFQIIAHDLRSPLISVESIARLIPYWIEKQDFESLTRLSETLELSVNNVLSLIDDLLNWALTQQNKFPTKPHSFYINDTIIKSIDIYKSIAEIKKINIRFNYAKDIKVFADQNILSAVIRNLLNNAVKFTPENGDISIGVEESRQFAKIWVTDTGVGIAKEKKDLVFDLAQGKEGTMGETGKGLGLFFCKEFVTMNNGEISIESDEGKGTTICFTLPLFDLEKN